MLSPNRFKIWLLVACLWLPACSLVPHNESNSGIAGQDQPDLENSSEQLSADPAGAIGPLAVTSPGASPADCLSPESQTIAQGIASSFEMPYEQVIDWHCAGHALEDILLALHTGDDLKIPPADLLARLDQGQTWEQIWEEIGWLK
jgi:hypothetical protein